MRAAPKFLFASALVFADLPVLATEETPKAPVPSAPSAVTKCPGIANIPMTADAEQSLPLRLVRSLSCGEPVYVLSEDEGYTVHIRTGDGTEGYVARLYLEEGSSSSPAIAYQARTASPRNGVVRWAAGAPGCDEFVSHGRHVESITANGITVQVSLQDTGWKYRANVAISNRSPSDVDVAPGMISLDELTPNLRPLPSSDSEKIARTSTHQVLWTLADGVPSPSAVVPELAHTSEADRLAYRSFPAPDYLDSQITLVSARQPAFAGAEFAALEALALKSASLAPEQTAAGVMWFARDAASHELSLRVPVGELVFDFSFSFAQKR